MTHPSALTQEERAAAERLKLIADGLEGVQFTLRGDLHRILSALNRLSSPESTNDRDALARYRAVTHWIGADSWDGCPDCVERLRWATSMDCDRDMTPDRIGGIMRPFFAERPGKPRTASHFSPELLAMMEAAKEYVTQDRDALQEHKLKLRILNTALALGRSLKAKGET